MGDITYNKSFEEKIKMNLQKFKSELKENREKNQIISNLCKEKKYDEVYQIYGKNAYTYVVPFRYMRKDIKKLLKKGKFEDIYLKYGSATYQKYLPKMQAIDIYCEIGKKKNTFFSNLKYRFKRKFLPYFVSSVVFLEAAPAVVLLSASDSITKDNARIYAEEISLYDRKIDAYASKINNLNLTDIQVIMKVMDDMWISIEGYGNPEKDVIGFGRLDFLDENGVGVCRNMADDFTAKLNAINPDYNARNLNVIMENTNYNLANINRKFVNIDDAENTTVSQEEQRTFFDINSKNMFGNHMVTLLDIPSENITLVIDPTNPSIGIFRNGEIYMFSTEDGKGLTIPHFKQYLNGTSAQSDYGVANIKSYFQSKEDIESLKSKWGLDAQNKALEEVRNLPQSQIVKINQENTNYNYYENTYEESYEINGKTK